MKTRTFLAFLHLLNFLIGISATIYVLNIFGNYLETWQVILYIYYIVLGFCGATIAYWIFVDGKDIEYSVAQIQELERRILDLERNIYRIKTRALEKL